MNDFDEDPLRAAKGIGLACLASLVFWVLVVVLLWNLTA